MEILCKRLHYLPNLEKFDIQSNWIGNKGITQLSKKLMYITKLKSLNIESIYNNNNIDNKTGNKKASKINIAMNYISVSIYFLIIKI